MRLSPGNFGTGFSLSGKVPGFQFHTAILDLVKIAAKVLLLVFSIAVVASPNESTALLRGVVLDQAGGAVSGATVRLISLGKVRDAKVNEAGKFEFVDLPFGTYDLTILQPGFAPHSVENLGT